MGCALDYDGIKAYAERIDREYDPKVPARLRVRNVLADMRKSGFPGLLEAVRKGQVGIHNSPGFSFATDKQKISYYTQQTHNAEQTRSVANEI